MFQSERRLVETAMRHLRKGRSPWGDVELLTEWDYRHGRADILARGACGQLVALEAKLDRWQVACDQAYRNTAYATRAYVLLPEESASRAYQHLTHFAERKIGLCSVARTGITVLIEAPSLHPLMAWVAELAHSTFDDLTHANTTARGRRSARLCTT